MSLVDGPRPLPDYHLEFRLSSVSFGAKSSGLTGMWQVSGPQIQVQEALDTYYIRNWSPWLDLHILARTVGAVLFPKGAY